MLSTVSRSAAPSTMPRMAPRPPNRLTPPTTTAAIAFSSKPLSVAKDGSISLMRVACRSPAKPAVTAQMMKAMYLTRATGTPTAMRGVAVAAGGEEVVAEAGAG